MALLTPVVDLCDGVAFVAVHRRGAALTVHFPLAPIFTWSVNSAIGEMTGGANIVLLINEGGNALEGSVVSAGVANHAHLASCFVGGAVAHGQL